MISSTLSECFNAAMTASESASKLRGIAPKAMDGNDHCLRLFAHFQAIAGVIIQRRMITAKLLPEVFAGLNTLPRTWPLGLEIEMTIHFFVTVSRLRVGAFDLIPIQVGPFIVGLRLSRQKKEPRAQKNMSNDESEFGRHLSMN
jgi:hypothetical protein